MCPLFRIHLCRRAFVPVSASGDVGKGIARFQDGWIQDGAIQFAPGPSNNKRIQACLGCFLCLSISEAGTKITPPIFTVLICPRLIRSCNHWRERPISFAASPIRYKSMRIHYHKESILSRVANEGLTKGKVYGNLCCVEAKMTPAELAALIDWVADLEKRVKALEEKK